MRGYVTKCLNSTIVNVRAQSLDGSGTIEFPVTIYGTRKIENDRKTFRMLEREAECADRCIIFEIVNTRYAKTVYRMPVDEFVEQAEKIQSM